MGGSSKPSTTTSQAQIPDFLKPYLTNQANVGNDALTSLQGMLKGAGADQLVTPFNANQIAGQDRALQVANDPNGALAQSQNALTDIAKGDVIGKYAPQMFDGYAAGMNAPNLAGVNTGTLQDFAKNGLKLDPISQRALDQSAGGEYMYGNAGFDEAVQASIRAVRPSILSGYAQGGSGAVKGGLAQIGMQQAASDSFARLFGDERNRQLTATGQLGNFSLGSRGLQQDAANQILQAEVAQRAQDIQQQGMRNQSTQAFGGLLSDERSRQLSAAGQLPGVGLLGSDILRDVGAEQQGLAQQQLTAPMTAQEMMLAAASGGPNFSSLIGQKTTQPVYRNRAGGALGGALTGAQLGSFIPGLGTTAGAIGGGLLGLLG